MASQGQVRLAYLSTNVSGGEHYDRFRTLTPSGVDVSFDSVKLWSGDLRELEGTLDAHVAATTALQAEHGWDGVGFLGAPMETQNPGFLPRLRDALAPTPVTTSMEASAAALNALGVSRLLLLTPFDRGLNAPIVEYLAGAGLDAVAPREFGHPAEAVALSDDETRALARDAFAEVPGCQGIYFQGARLDPLGVIEPLERELGVPVVASTAAMLWWLCSTLGHSFPSAGLGRIVSDWPALA